MTLQRSYCGPRRRVASAGSLLAAAAACRLFKGPKGQLDILCIATGRELRWDRKRGGLLLGRWVRKHYSVVLTED